MDYRSDFSNITDVTLNNNSKDIELHMDNEINETNIILFHHFINF